MSNSETAAESFPLKVTSEPDVRITIYDGWGDVVGEGSGYLEQDLPRGFYEIRTELAGEIEQELIRHDRRMEEPHRAKSPGRYSPAPLQGALTSHEYYTGPAEEWSRRDTCEVPIGGKGPAMSRLFLFVRAVSREQVTDRDLTAGLLMTTPSGKVLCEPSVDREHTRRDDDDGWVAFSADVACRTIFLKYTGEPARTVPIHFDPGWETQLFLLHHGRPRFETMKFFMVGKGAGFQANDEVARNVDLALTGLQNRTNLLPRPVMDDLLNGKFRNPIEGLIGAHFLLRELEPDAERIDLVLRNLASLLPNSPDVRALEILGAQRLSRPIDPEPLGEPPMLRAGLEAVIAASAEVRGLIPRGSVLDRICSRVFADTPWSSWKSLFFEVRDLVEPLGYSVGAIVGAIAAVAGGVGVPVASSAAYAFALGKSWFGHLITYEASKEEAWVVRSALGRIIDTLHQGGAPSLPDIARELRLTPGAVVRALAGVAQDLNGFDLRLMSSLNDVSGIPTEGKNLIIVAAVNHVLHFRIFDGDGRVVVDTDEKRLTEKARQIEDLRKQLESLWPPHELAKSDKGRVITAVTSIVGHINLKSLGEITRQLGGSESQVRKHVKRLLRE